MNHDQAAHLIELLRDKGFTLGCSGADIEISIWSEFKPQDINPEVLESVRCLKADIRKILTDEAATRLARVIRRIEKEQQKWKPKRNHK